MNASTFAGMCRFLGGLPMLIFRDHVEGRIKVFSSGEWVATLIPGELLGTDTEGVLMFKDENNSEFRDDWGYLAHYLSEYQQANCDIGAVFDAENYRLEELYS